MIPHCNDSEHDMADYIGDMPAKRNFIDDYLVYEIMH